MKALTLTDYIEEKSKQDAEFEKNYTREQIINSIAEMILNARKSAHLTQLELAQKVGTTQSVISRIESGTSKWIPFLETLARISETLNKRLDVRIH